ncbi:MAG: hypothetical protein H0X37_18660 [Herpetosiphonaceae bacterium]|nr:hypothetical protein [Herpetosiphonaceae bacterium]
MVYTAYVGYGTLSPAYYSYCGSGSSCSNAANWQTVTFGSGKDYVVKAEIALPSAVARTKHQRYSK